MHTLRRIVHTIGVVIDRRTLSTVQVHARRLILIG